MLIYHWSPPLCENLPSKRVYLSMRNISIAKCCFFSSISPHNCLTIHPTRYLRAICTIFWHPASYILHEIPGRGLFHLYGQNFGQTRGPRCCNFRRGNSASYFRGERCDRWGLAVGRKLTEKVKKAASSMSFSK